MYFRDFLGTTVGEQIVEAGKTMVRFIPEPIRAHTVYSADAVVDDDGRVWWLEMNCNPMVPPETYAPLLDGMFGFVPPFAGSSGTVSNSDSRT